MIPLPRILPWTLRSRLHSLETFTALVEKYYRSIKRDGWISQEPIETEESSIARDAINQSCDEVREIIRACGVTTSVSPLKVGNLKVSGVSVDLITNMFILAQYGIGHDKINDVIQRANGAHKRALARALVNIVNPFNYVWLAVYSLSQAFAGVFDAMGISRSRVTGSIFFRIIRWLLTIAGDIVVVVSLLKLFGCDESLLKFIRSYF